MKEPWVLLKIFQENSHVDGICQNNLLTLSHQNERMVNEEHIVVHLTFSLYIWNKIKTVRI